MTSKPSCLLFEFALILLFVLVTGCDKEEDPSLPVMQTIDISNVTSNNAHAGGFIVSDGGAEVTERGVCWNTIPEPTIEQGRKTSDGSGIGSYQSIIVDLSPGTTYYVRAYSTNKAGTVYGNELTFKTSAVLAEISTLTPTTITTTTAVGGGNVITDGGSTVTARGVCWSQTENPTVALSTKTTDGNGTGEFSSSITGLAPGTTYHVRAYATNETGTAYGNEISFTTEASLPALTTNAITDITFSSASGGGNITSDGGAAVTARGVCWSTASSPTTTNDKTTNGTGTGSFTSPFSGLFPSTEYHVRAYATNSAGTAYGNEITFTTSVAGNLLTINDIDGNTYDMVLIGTQNWMAENLRTAHYRDGSAVITGLSNANWTSTTSGAYCVMLDNPASFEQPYGKLYNFYAVADSRKLCPVGSHLPSESEWNVLINYLGGASVAGGEMKITGTTYWDSPNGGATNSSGFNGLPGGFRDNFGYGLLRNYGNHWSTTEVNNTEARSLSLRSNDGQALSGTATKFIGYSVRCLQDPIN